MDARTLGMLATVTLLLIVLGVAELTFHRRRLARIPLRIHVNGTRGKSSVTRLIVAGLRAGGITTVGKTTGTVPRILHPDGAEEPVYRVGRPNVIEQVGVVRRADELGAQALVIECMALQPFLQWISTARLVRPTHAVITNVRADHLEVMGPTVNDVARALAGSVPSRSRLFTTEAYYLNWFKQVCEHRKTRLVPVGSEEISAVPERELRAFSYIEHAENVALALAVCEDAGVEREVALAGMRRVVPDPGALTVIETEVDGSAVTFVNGFAANDPESTERVWNLALEREGEGRRRIALVNCRLDRPERSQQLGVAMASWTSADSYVVTGSGTTFFTQSATRAGINRARLHVAERETVASLVTRLSQVSGARGLVVGLGNIGGIGLELMDYLHDAAEAA